MTENLASAAATAASLERERVRAQGRRTVWSGVVMIGVAIVFSNLGGDAQREFSHSVLSDPFAIEIYGRPWFASGQAYYFISGVSFVAAVVCLLIGGVRLLTNPKPKTRMVPDSEHVDPASGLGDSMPGPDNVAWWQNVSAQIMGEMQDPSIEALIASSERQMREGRNRFMVARSWKTRGLTPQAAARVASRAEQRFQVWRSNETERDVIAGNFATPAMASASSLVAPSAFFGMPGGAGSPKALRKDLVKSHGLSPRVADYLVQRADTQSAFQRSSKIRLATGLIALIVLAFLPLFTIKNGVVVSATVVPVLIVIAIYHMLQSASVLVRAPSGPAMTPSPRASVPVEPMQPSPPPRAPMSVGPLQPNPPPRAPMSVEPTQLRPSAPASAVARFCGRCGTRVEQGNQFCTSCGASVILAPQSSSPS